MDSIIEFFTSATGHLLPEDLSITMCKTHSDYIDSALETFLRVGAEKEELHQWKDVVEHSKGLTIYSNGRKNILVDESQLASESERDRVIFHELGHAGTADAFKACLVDKNDFYESTGYKFLKELFACYDSNVCIKEKYKNIVTDETYDQCIEYFCTMRKKSTFSDIKNNATSMAECVSVLVVFFEDKLTKEKRLNGLELFKVTMEYIEKPSISICDCKRIVEKLFFH